MEHDIVDKEQVGQNAMHRERGRSELARSRNCSTTGHAHPPDTPTPPLHTPCTPQTPPSARMQRTASLLRSAISHSLSYGDQSHWEDVEDDLCLILKGNEAHLEHLRRLYTFEGLRRIEILSSLAVVASRADAQTDGLYTQQLEVLARFFSVATWPSKRQRLAALQALMQCLSPPEASWQYKEPVVEFTLHFLLTSDCEWEYLPHTEEFLLHELRAMCLFLLDRQESQRRVVERTGDSAARIISTGAKLVHMGLTKAVLPSIETRIEHAGEQLKGHLQPSSAPLILDRDAVVAMAYSNAAKSMSNTIQEAASQATQSIKETSVKGINLVSQKINESGIDQHVVPHPPTREAVRAAGKVGLATLGAAAVVGEAMLETGRALLEKSSNVTANVVEFKYGTSAGQVVRDAGDTGVNLVKAAGHVALLESSAIAKSVAKETGKQEVEGHSKDVEDTIQYLTDQSKSLLLLPSIGKLAVANQLLSGRIEHQQKVTTMRRSWSASESEFEALPESCQRKARKSTSCIIDRQTFPVTQDPKNEESIGIGRHTLANETHPRVDLAASPIDTENQALVTLPRQVTAS